MKTSVIEINNLTIGYSDKKSEKIVCENINGSLKSGELTCLLGPNGAGKSTLLKTLCGFLKPLGGSISLNGNDISSFSIKELAKKIGVVLTERPSIQNMTVSQLVSLGRSPYTDFWGRLQSEDQKIVINSIKKVGIWDLRNRLVSDLSDGERQKAMIAKALAQETPVIFLDEPTAFLDLPSKVEVMQLLHYLAQETGKTIFVSVHDLELALQVADKIWLIGKDNNELAFGSPEDLMMKDEFGRFFERDGIQFDNKTGLFVIKNRHYHSINIKGHGFKYVLLRKALSRNGIAVTKDESLYRVEIQDNNESPFLLYKENDLQLTSDSIEKVVELLKRCFEKV